MIGWCIAGGVLLLFLLILLTPVVFSVNYDDFRDIFMWKVSWLGIPLLCSTGIGLFQRKKKPQEQAKPKKKQKKKPEKPEDAKEKMRRSWDMYWSLIRRVPKALRLLWKGISIRKLTIGVQVGRFDASVCAQAYGAANAAVYTALGLLQSMMRVSVEQVQIRCAFGTEKTNWIVRGKLCACLLAVLAAACSVVLGLLSGGKKPQSVHAKEEPPMQKQNAASEAVSAGSRR